MIFSCKLLCAGALAGGIIVYLGRNIIAKKVELEIRPLITSGLMRIGILSKRTKDFRRRFRDSRIGNCIHSGARLHTHAESMENRAISNLEMDQFILSCGMIPFSYSCSGGENGKMPSYRQYFTGKDLSQVPRNDSIGPKHFVRMTDVDYYVDMPHFLNGRNVILYTFVPSKVGGSSLESCFYVGEGDYINVEVFGGGKYKHQVWDYDTDHLLIDHWWGTSLYLVEQRQVSVDRRIILLNHNVNVYGPLAWLLPGKRLLRRRFVYGNVVHSRHLVNVEKHALVQHSLSYINGSFSTNISDESFRQALHTLRRAKTPSAAMIERYFRSENEIKPHSAALIVLELFLSGYKIVESSVTSRCVDDDNSPNYQTSLPLVTEEGGASSARVVGEVILDEGFAPVRSYNNDHACIEGRINNVKNPVVRYDKFTVRCMQEFVAHVIPDDKVGTGVPIDYEEMESKLIRPSQRVQISEENEEFLVDTSWSVSAFQKKEVYSKIDDPRNISKLPMRHNFPLGQYSYAFSENILKETDWYAFGKHPMEVSSLVHDKCRDSLHVLPTDFSRMDGSTGRLCFELTVLLMVRYFGPEYHDEIIRLLQRESRVRGKTSMGILYEAIWNTLSGSSMTSWRNSCINAFIAYLTWRYSIDDPKAAYLKLGVYGGDDGLSPDMDGIQFVTVSAKLGMLAKAEIRTIGQSVPFLGRIYLDPWTSIESVIDVRRQLRKFHLSCTPNTVPNDLAIHWKVDGLISTDFSTPIISNLCRAVRRCIPRPSEQQTLFINVDKTYWSRFESPYPEITDQELALQIIAENLEVDVEKVQSFCDLVDSFVNKSDFKQVRNYFSANLVNTIEASYRGELLPRLQSKSHLQKVRENYDNIKTPLNYQQATTGKNRPLVAPQTPSGKLQLARVAMLAGNRGETQSFKTFKTHVEKAKCTYEPWIASDRATVEEAKVFHPPEKNAPNDCVYQPRSPSDSGDELVDESNKWEYIEPTTEERAALHQRQVRYDKQHFQYYHNSVDLNATIARDQFNSDDFGLSYLPTCLESYLYKHGIRFSNENTNAILNEMTVELRPDSSREVTPESVETLVRATVERHVNKALNTVTLKKIRRDSIPFHFKKDRRRSLTFQKRGFYIPTMAEMRDSPPVKLPKTWTREREARELVAGTTDLPSVQKVFEWNERDWGNNQKVPCTSKSTAVVSRKRRKKTIRTCPETQTPTRSGSVYT